MTWVGEETHQGNVLLKCVWLLCVTCLQILLQSTIKAGTFYLPNVGQVVYEKFSGLHDFLILAKHRESLKGILSAFQLLY